MVVAVLMMTAELSCADHVCVRAGKNADDVDMVSITATHIKRARKMEECWIAPAWVNK